MISPYCTTRHQYRIIVFGATPISDVANITGVSGPMWCYCHYSGGDTLFNNITSHCLSSNCSIPAVEGLYGPKSGPKGVKLPGALLVKRERQPMSSNSYVDGDTSTVYDDDGRTVIPQKPRDALDLEGGDQIDYFIAGDVVIMRKSRDTDE